MSLLEEAVDFAVIAHRGQVRKFDGTAYIQHPFAVMGMMTEFTSSSPILSAAVLHDTVEDSRDVTIEIIHERFGEEVGSYVFYASEKSRKSDGSRFIRKEIDRRHYASGPDISQDIKGLDMLHNIPTMVLYDPKFALVYLDEKMQLLGVLHKMNPIIKSRALNLISKMYELLNK